MAFNFNGNTPKKILYNGLNVAKLIYNGVVVWMSKVLAAIEGILPLTLTNSTGDDLVGYKIYGNSGGVGDRTKNLFNINTATPVYISHTGSEEVADQRNLTSDFISVIPGESYIWKAYPTTNGHPWSAVAFYTNGQFVSRTTVQLYTLTFTVPENVNSIRVGSRYMQNGGRGQLELGTDVTSYESYGFKIPVLTNSHTTNIYLNKPLRKTSKLPSGYTELQHIRGTGTQYIDIGRKMYNYSELELCFSFDEMQQDCSIFGSRTSSTTNNFEIASTATGYPIYLDFGHFNTSRATYNNAVINTKYICTISKSLRAVYDENRTLLASNTALISANNTTPSNARIFDTAGGYSANKLKGKVYYCKVWENGVLVRNMIPCKNPSNVIGMYDTVNDAFYSNAGSGSFIAGAEVETVYYTDYLDYENQKVVRNVDDNDKGIDTPVEESVTLPTVPTDEGTVTVDVDTEIAPSYAEVKYYKNGV